MFFNGPRAGVNFNDGFCGGHTVEQNLIFNTCRESGDHGPFNSWDRIPYVATSRTSGKPRARNTSWPVPGLSTITRNFIFADYDGVKALDHDDGSSFYDDVSNVIYMGWGQKTFLPSPGAKLTRNSLFLFSPSLLTDHGGETSPDFAEIFANNTVVFPNLTKSIWGAVDSVEQITGETTVTRSNTFFAPHGDISAMLGKAHTNFAGLQAAGAEVNSRIISSMPTDDMLKQMVMNTLGIQ